MNKMKFYEKNWFMWLMLILFAPVGICLMWIYHPNMKKITKIILTIIFSLLFIGAMFGNSDEPDTNPKDDMIVETDKVVKVTVVDFSQQSVEDIDNWCNDNKINCVYEKEYSNDVENGMFISQSAKENEEIKQGSKLTIVYSMGAEPSKEFKNALKNAESYSNIMHMSKAAIFNQLTSEYGEGFEKDAAQYAIDNLEADYNANALAKAESYSDTMHMSKASIYDQLISEYGEQFTEEEAQYAVDNLLADYNANALAKAKSYQNDMNMSVNAIYDQLISEYGEQFTEEEAQYAIDNLE